MTFIGKMILIGLGGVTSTTGATLLIVNKDKLFKTNVTKGIQKDTLQKQPDGTNVEKIEQGEEKDISQAPKDPIREDSEETEEGLQSDTLIQGNGRTEENGIEVQNNGSEDGSPKEKDYICRFEESYAENSNKKKIKDFLENPKWKTKIIGIQILGEGKDNFTCAKDMNDDNLAGIIEYLSDDKEIESGLSSVSGRPKTDNVIALKKKENGWTGFGIDEEEGSSEELLSPIKKNNS